MIYAISDIHGCIDALKKKMEPVDLSGDSRIIFLGDYIDYGDHSCQVVEYIRDLQEEYGDEKVVALRGNHEEAFLDWIREYRNPARSELDALTTYNDWLRSDSDCDLKTFRTFISEERLAEFEENAKTASFDSLNRMAVQMILEKNTKLIGRMKKLPYYYETDDQIFVHAGIEEAAGVEWKHGTSKDVMLWKFPPSTGSFYKTIISGHVGTGLPELADNPDYHDIFYDGESHIYIDGAVYKDKGKLLLLGYDEHESKYYQIEESGWIEL